ncbi:MAG: hypothetical protein GY790_18415 [Bacteroidetes bacterium]|nr:hypothetical protein [Bacteroidota bacterium]
MGNNEIDRLVFRRQYLLLPGQIDCPFIHDTLEVGSYKLYTHPDLVVTEFRSPDKQLILLGDMFDYADPGKDNSNILTDLANVDFEALLKMSAQYSGRFVLIIAEKGRFIILHDSTAARKVYFVHRNGEPWFSSQQHLLAKVLGLSSTENPSRLEFYRSDYFISLNNSNLGNTTYYNEIEQLMPNHYFDINTSNKTRYWPKEPLLQMTFNEVAAKCTAMIEGYMKSIANRYKIMLPVTAGGDSRLLMSATREFSQDVFYYINQGENTIGLNRDVEIAGKIFRQQGMVFNVLTLPTEIDEDFEKIYFENNPIASKSYLPHIYNYHINYSDRVNLPGNIASASWGVYQMNRENVSIEELTKYYGVHKYDYAQEYYHQWMTDIRELCNECNLNVINLFYWEERIANWGGQISIDKDIAQEDFNPLNSRLLNELFLSLPLKYNNEPDKKLHAKIIRNLWPELMKMPFNPSLRNSVLYLLARLGLFTPVARTLYRLKSKSYSH